MNFSDLAFKDAHREKKGKFMDKYRAIDNISSIFDSKQDLYSVVVSEYDNLTIDLYNLAILSNDLHVMSIEQQRFFERYLLEGNSKTNDTSYVMSYDMDELNKFLGTHRGECYNGRKQFKRNKIKRFYC